MVHKIHTLNNSNIYLNSRRHIKFLDGRIYEYETNKFITQSEEQSLIKINGGLIYDETGIGKTLQFICLAISNPLISTLILVPDHLYAHWNNQFKIHIKPNVFINKYSKYPITELCFLISEVSQSLNILDKYWFNKLRLYLGPIDV